ncbi:hypothetical protein BU26DRAFT_608632 [Trematosphaeria pertusa]|uniref:Cyanovirin-N domain-containing protein n=1 Tax=Trematosphaeria pertusa TaxID=390896 RepID=A0A6A6I1L8_9PLEO|nr:uncharacterized protein BU26DRAFT_608632 [Trematosphaeria pertusa]KAF2244167.1 hypothetical protein BU26DRAFT_608632 [Trematosphaeria pertusa]
MLHFQVFLLLSSLLSTSLVTAGGDYGPDICLEGFVWREATPDDHVCVKPSSRDAATWDNSQQASRQNADGTCKGKWVKRRATASDTACVSRTRKIFTNFDNAAGPDRRLSMNVWFGPSWDMCPPCPHPSCNGDICEVHFCDFCHRYLQIEGDHFNLGTNNIEIWMNRPNYDNEHSIRYKTVSGTALAGKIAGGFVQRVEIDD